MPVNFLGLRTCIYKVSDLEKAKEWYTNLLGIAPYFDQHFYVGYSVGGYELGLQPEENPDDSVKTGSVATFWGVADIDATFSNLILLGAKAEEEPMDVGGDIKVATVRDPWGNLVGIIYNPHFGSELQGFQH